MTHKNISESQFLVDLPPSAGIGKILRLDAEESAHAVKVFRHRVGDVLRIGNGKGLQGLATLVEASAASASLELLELSSWVNAPRLHLAIACLKDNDLEEVMDSCAQLPLASLTLLRTDHSQEPRDSDLKRTVRRLELKSLVAFKQSLKPWLTAVQGPMPFSTWLAQCTGQVILCDIDGSRTLPTEMLEANGPDLILAVGPEGGFSPAEIAGMHGINAHILALGPTRLRAKTCPIVALGALIGMGFCFANDAL